MSAEATLQTLKCEVRAAGLRLSEADLARIFPLWQENWPRRAWLRAENFDGEETASAGADLGKAPLLPASAAELTPLTSGGTRRDASPSDMTDLGLSEVASALADGQFTATDLVEAYLQRLAAHDGALHTASHVLADEAVRQARESDARRLRRAPLSAIDGVPIGVKDCIAVEHAPLEGGSGAFSGHIAMRDAVPVAALRRAGAIILTKQRMHELGAGPAIPQGQSSTGRNPYDPARIPGGSSSGSAAAVAAGFCAGALGSDAAGSVRIPAAFCGLVGLKPTFGLLQTTDCLPLTRSLDTIGTLTRDVAGAALLLAHASDVSYLAPLRRPEAVLGSRSLARVRIGLLRRYYWDAPDLRADVREATETAIQVFCDLGAELVTVDIPSIDRNDVAYTTLLAESFTLHGELALRDPSPLSDWLRAQILTAALFTADDVRRAQQLQRRIRAEALDALRHVDVLAHPGMAEPPGAFGTMFITALTQPRSRFTRPWNVTGLPALALPCGLSCEGLPVSLQLAGRPFAEPTLLDVAAAFENQTGWKRVRPDPSRWIGL